MTQLTPASIRHCGVMEPIPTWAPRCTNPSWSATIQLTQTISPSLLNETSFLYSGNKITLTPVSGPGSSFTQPDWLDGHQLLPRGQQSAKLVCRRSSWELPTARTGPPATSLGTTPIYSYQLRDDLSWTRGTHQFKFGFSYLRAPKNQQLQANTQGTAQFNSSTFSDDSYVNFLLGDVATFTQLNYLAGKHWVNNNYGFYVNDNWHVLPGLTLNLGLRFDGIAARFRALRSVCELRSGRLRHLRALPAQSRWHAESCFPDHFEWGFVLSEWCEGSECWRLSPGSSEEQL